MPPSGPPEKKYKCQYCSRAFSRSEHKSRHERSHTKERPFKCMKCRSTFVRRDLLLRHDRTVHAKDGGIPLVSQGRRKGKRPANAAAAAAAAATATAGAAADGQLAGAATAAGVAAAHREEEEGSISPGAPTARFPLGGSSSPSTSSHTGSPRQAASLQRTTYAFYEPDHLQHRTEARAGSDGGHTSEEDSEDHRVADSPRLPPHDGGVQLQPDIRPGAALLPISPPHHRLHPPPPGSRTIDPAALSAPTAGAAAAGTPAAAIATLAGTSATPPAAYAGMVDSEPDLDVELEVAAMLMTDFQTKAAASTASLRSRTSSPAAGSLPHRHQQHFQQQHQHQQQQLGQLSPLSRNASRMAPTSVPSRDSAYTRPAHGPHSSTPTPERAILLEPEVDLDMDYRLGSSGPTTTAAAATTMPHLSPAVSFTGPASAESIGTTYLPHIQMKPDIAGEGVTSRYLSSPMHAPHPFLDRKRHRGVDQEVKPGGPLPPFLLSDAVGNAETPSSRHHFSPHLSGDIPSLLHSVTAHRGSGSPIGRTPPPSSSRHSTPHSFSPQQAYVYPYPPSLTPGLGLTSRPPGPGSVGSAAGGHLNMGSLLNLSPLIGSKKEASLSPGPRLLGSADPPGSGGPSGGGLGGPALAPTSAPLPFSQKGRDDDDGGELDWRSGKRRKADENALDSHARAGGFQPVKFPLGYPDTIPQLANDADYRRLLEVISVTEEGANNVHVLPDTLHPVPDRTTINAYLQAYFTQFHPHLPFLHVPSMSDSLTATPPALFLAILSIGALHDHSHESFVLHVASKSLVHAFLGQTTDFDSRACPLWAMQSILLNMIFGSWSGGAKGLEWTSSIKSLLGNLVSGSRYALRGRIEARQKTVGADGKRHPSWEEWISEESCRRTIFAVFIFFGLLSMVFNQPNSMIVGDELDELELPCEEEVWAAPRAYVEKYWSESASSGGSLSERGSESHDVHDDMDAATGASDTTQPPTVRIAQSALFKGEQVRYSSYATRVMITVLFYEVWNHRRTVAALQDVVIEFKLRLALDAWESGLRAKIAEEQAKMHERCRLLADDHARPDSAGQWGPSRSAPLMPPLLANSLAIYRVSRIRLAIDLKPVQEALRYHSPYEIAATMTVARQLVKRDPAARIEDAVRECCEGVEEVISAFRRPSPLTASVSAARIRTVASAYQSRRPSTIYTAHSAPSSSSSSSTASVTGPSRALSRMGDRPPFSCGYTPTSCTPRSVTALSATLKSAWAVEHPLALVDMLVILTLWLYRLENAGQTILLPSATASGMAETEPEPEASDAEISLFQRVRNLVGGLDEDVGRATGPAELSAGVARLWGALLDPDEDDGADATMHDAGGPDDSAPDMDIARAALAPANRNAPVAPTVWLIETVLGESFKLHSQALIGYRDDAAFARPAAPPSPQAATTMQEPAGSYTSQPIVATTTEAPLARYATATFSTAAMPLEPAVSTGPVARWPMEALASTALPPPPLLRSALPTASSSATPEAAPPGPESAAGTTAPDSTAGVSRRLERPIGARGLPTVGTAY